MFVFGVRRGGLNNFVALFLAFHWPDTFHSICDAVGWGHWQRRGHGKQPLWYSRLQVPWRALGPADGNLSGSPLSTLNQKTLEKVLSPLLLQSDR